MSSAESTKPRPRRRTADETRLLMLRAGAQLAVARLQADDEEAASRALAHIRLTDVAQAATELEARHTGQAGGAITTGAIYQLWSSQAAFQADLMHYVVSEAPLPAAEQLLPRTLELVAAGRPVEQIVVDLVTMAFDESRETPEYALALLFVPYARGSRVGEALQRTYEQLHEAARPIYEALLSYGRLQVRAPWTLDDLVTAIAALHDGCSIRERIEAGSLPTRGERTIVAEGSLALFRGFTEPAAG